MTRLDEATDLWERAKDAFWNPANITGPQRTAAAVNVLHTHIAQKPEKFMDDCEVAAQNSYDDMIALLEGDTVYDRAHGLFSIIERLCAVLGAERYGVLHRHFKKGDIAMFDATLNALLEVRK